VHPRPHLSQECGAAMPLSSSDEEGNEKLDAMVLILFALSLLILPTNKVS
jgi:hypothetical protein